MNKYKTQIIFVKPGKKMGKITVRELIIENYQLNQINKYGTEKEIQLPYEFILDYKENGLDYKFKWQKGFSHRII